MALPASPLPSWLSAPAPRDDDEVRALVAESRRGVFLRVFILYALLVAGLVALGALTGHTAYVVGALVVAALFGGVFWAVGGATRRLLAATLKAGTACDGRITGIEAGGFRVGGVYKPRGLLVELTLPGGQARKARFPLPTGAPGRLAEGAAVHAVVDGGMAAVLVEREGGGFVGYVGSLV